MNKLICATNIKKVDEIFKKEQNTKIDGRMSMKSVRQSIGNKCLIFLYGWVGEEICLRILIEL